MQELNVVYHGTGFTAYKQMLHDGYITNPILHNNIRSVWVTKDIEIAKKCAKKHIFENDIPVILIIDVASIIKNNIQLYNTWNDNVNFETDDIPITCITSIIIG